MKKFVNPLSSGGAPVFATETLSEVLGKEIWDTHEAMPHEVKMGDFFRYPSLYDGIILKGCEVTNTAANTWDISSGIVFHPDNGIGRFAGATGVTASSYLSLNPSAPIIEQKTFFDSVAKDYTTDIISELTTDAGATAASAVIFVNSSEVRWRPTLNSALRSIGGDCVSRTYPITNWDMDTDAVYTFNFPYIQEHENKYGIVNAQCWIRQDGLISQQVVNLERPASGGTEYGYIEIINNDNTDNGFVVNLNRITGGFFDSTNFSAPGTRGFLKIDYYIDKLV